MTNSNSANTCKLYAGALSAVYALESAQSNKLIALLNTCTSERRVVCLGIGKMHHVAQLATDTLASLGLPGIALDCTSMLHGSLGYLGHDDICICLSKSGTTAELIATMSAIAEVRPSVQLVLITCNQLAMQYLAPRLPEQANVLCIVLPAECGNELNGYSPTTSTVAFTTYLMGLAHMVQRFDQLTFRKHHPGGSAGSEACNKQ